MNNLIAFGERILAPWRRSRGRRAFNQVFHLIGEAMPYKKAFAESLRMLTNTATAIHDFSMDQKANDFSLRDTHAEIFMRDSMNACVARSGDKYFLGIDNALLSNARMRIWSVLEKNFSMQQGPRDLLGTALWFDAIAFAIMHEVNHVALKHLDRYGSTLGDGICMWEMDPQHDNRLATATLMDEAGADMRAAVWVCYQFISGPAREARLRDFGSAESIALIGISVSAIISSFYQLQQRPAIEADASHLYPIVRIILCIRYVIDTAGFYAAILDQSFKFNKADCEKSLKLGIDSLERTAPSLFLDWLENRDAVMQEADHIQEKLNDDLTTFTTRLIVFYAGRLR